MSVMLFDAYLPNSFFIPVSTIQRIKNTVVLGMNPIRMK